MKSGWIVVIEPSTNAIVVSSSYNLLVNFNHLHPPLFKWIVEEVLVVFYGVVAEAERDDGEHAENEHFEEDHVMHIVLQAPFQQHVATNSSCQYTHQ